MVKGRIEKIDDQGNMCFRMEIAGQTRSFNVNYLPKDRYEWFIDVVSRLLSEVFWAGQTDAKNEINEKFDVFIQSFK